MELLWPVPPFDERDEQVLLVCLEHDVADGDGRDGHAHLEEVEGALILLDGSEDHPAVVEEEQDVSGVPPARRRRLSADVGEVLVLEHGQHGRETPEKKFLNNYHHSNLNI